MSTSEPLSSWEDGAPYGVDLARNDVELVRGIASGDHHAFLELHDRFQVAA